MSHSHHHAVSGRETASVRASGWGRLIEIPFLAAWLVMWAIGEAVVLFMLIGLLAGGLAALFEWPLPFPPPPMPPPTAGAISLIVPFLLLWLAIWSVGGAAALTHMLRALAGEDRFTISPLGLAIEWRAGPFRRRRTIPLDAIRRVRLRMQHPGTLAIDTATGTLDLTTLGTRDERAALLAWLRQRLVLPDARGIRRLDAATTPPGWQVEQQDGETRLMRLSRRGRAIGGAVLWAVAAIASAGWIAALGAGRLQDEGHASLALSALLAAWAAWLTWDRSAWVVARGRLVWRRRFGTWQRERSFDAATLEVAHHVDSDGDDRYTLRVRGSAGARKIASELHDDAEVNALAEWLSARTGFPIDGR